LIYYKEFAPLALKQWKLFNKCHKKIVAKIFLNKNHEDNKMNVQLMVQPSSFIDSGIQMKLVRNLYLFKFNDDLQDRLEFLNKKKRDLILTSDEDSELKGMLELDRIFTLLNAKIIAESL
jgi:hypothetical protein